PLGSPGGFAGSACARGTISAGIDWGRMRGLGESALRSISSQAGESDPGAGGPGGSRSCLSYSANRFGAVHGLWPVHISHIMIASDEMAGGGVTWAGCSNCSTAMYSGVPSGPEVPNDGS